jgi:alkylhydroperoxidase/carboxymuconolactone decarboxylase family protein YurZ
MFAWQKIGKANATPRQNAILWANFSAVVCNLYHKESIMPNPLSAMYKLDPGLQSHMDAVNKFVYSDGALPKKYKLIIALAFDAAHGAELGVKSLAASAIQAGATKEEIVEAVRVAYLLSGVPALFTASQGLAGLAGEA